MATARLYGRQDVNHYHCLSRIVNRSFWIGEEEKEVFRRMMRQVEAFCGVEILTYCIMSNHFHVLVRVEKKPVPEAEVVRRVRVLYGDLKADELLQELAKRREWEKNRALAPAAGGSTEGDPEAGFDTVEGLLDQYRYRMGNISEFMKSLKQRFSRYMNKKKKRRGVMWEERFKSVLVEGPVKLSLENRSNPLHHAIQAIAAYIDLNPIRAGVCQDPSEYRWSGYGEACGGIDMARAGIARVLGDVELNWDVAGAQYRLRLFGRGQAKGKTEQGEPVHKGFAAAQMQTVRENKGRMSVGEVIRCRVRYFIDGVALGTKEFVEGVFQEHRDRFTARRKDGARRLKAADWGEIRSLRDLKVDPVVPVDASQSLGS
jgi:REP element-mobilizing transposase RayT